MLVLKCLKCDFELLFVDNCVWEFFDILKWNVIKKNLNIEEFRLGVFNFGEIDKDLLF